MVDEWWGVEADLDHLRLSLRFAVPLQQSQAFVLLLCQRMVTTRRTAVLQETQPASSPSLKRREREPLAQAQVNDTPGPSTAAECGISEREAAAAQAARQRLYGNQAPQVCSAYLKRKELIPWEVVLVRAGETVFRRSGDLKSFLGLAWHANLRVSRALLSRRARTGSNWMWCGDTSIEHAVMLCCFYRAASSLKFQSLRYHAPLEAHGYPLRQVLLVAASLSLAVAELS